MECRNLKKTIFASISVTILVISLFSTMAATGNLEFGEGGELILLRGVDEKETVEDLDAIGNVLDRYGKYVIIEVSESRLNRVEDEFKGNYDIDYLEDRNELTVKGHTFDTSEGFPELKSDLMIDGYEHGTEGLYLVDMIGPVNPEWRIELEEKGADILNYIPNYAYEVEMTPSEAEEIEELFFVDWVGPYQPEFKIEHNLRQEFEGISSMNRESLKVNVRLRPGYESETVEDIRESSVDIISSVDLEDGRRLRVEIDMEHQLEEIALLEDVYYVSEYIEPEFHAEMDIQQIGGGMWFMDDEHDDPDIPYRKHGEYGAYINQIGYSGEDITVTVADTGVGDGTEGDAGHPDFTGRVIDGYSLDEDEEDWSDHHNHGTMAAGLVAGDTHRGFGMDYTDAGGFAPYYIGQGLAYESDIFAMRLSDEDANIIIDDYYEVVEEPAQRTDTYVHTNSWGSATFGMYREADEIFDQAVRDADRDTEENRQMVITTSAGNEGPDDQTVGSPSTAKNLITVGGNQPYDPTEGYENPYDMYPASSRGWTEDNRVKPDVVAPSEFIWSQSSPLTEGDYSASSGTSFGNPLVAGAATIVVEWFEEKHDVRPSPAMVRSILINTANELDSEQGDTRGPIPNQDEGWGIADVSRLEYPKDDPIDFMFEDQESLLETGEVDEFEVGYDVEDEPLKMTLSWTDEHAQEGDSTGGTPTLKNNLDLEVETPSGEIIRGNAFDLTGDGESNDGFTHPDAEVMEDFDFNDDGWDDVNNVQNVFIPPEKVERGGYTVRVIGTDIPADANNDGEANQDYALSVYNADEEQPPEIEVERPIGGSYLEAGTEKEILWNTEEGVGEITEIDLEYSLDGGESWDNLVEGHEDTGKYLWEVPQEVTEEAMIRATIYDDFPQQSEYTTGEFTITDITPPDVDLESPDGNEEWRAGYDEEIVWQSHQGDGSIVGVDIEYTSDAGESWETIAEDVEDTGSYLWEIPDLTSSESRVRIWVNSDDGTAGYDFSEDNFDLVGYPPEPPENLEVGHEGLEDNILTWEKSEDDHPSGLINEQTHSDFEYQNEERREGTEEIDHLGPSYENIEMETGSAITSTSLESKGLETETGEEVELEHRSFEEDIKVEQGGRVDNEDESDEWRWLYDADHRPTQADGALGLTGPGVWYGAMRLDLSDDVGDALTEIAYFNDEDAANYVQGHIAEDDGDVPGEWLASTEEFEPEVTEWAELDLERPLQVEEPGEYWVVLEIDDRGDGHHPFAYLEPHIEDGAYINMADPHNPADWETLPDLDFDKSWLLEARVEDIDSHFQTEITSYQEHVDEGDELTIEYQVENVIGNADSQEIEFRIYDEVEDTENVTLGPGDIHEGKFTWETEENDVGYYLLDVVSEDDSERVRVQVGEPEWRWLYEDEQRAEPDDAAGLAGGTGIWHAAIRLDLADEVGNALSDIAYYDASGVGIPEVQAHVAIDEEDAPGYWYSSSEPYEPTGEGWVELELEHPVIIEEPDQYWVVLEFNDTGIGNNPFGVSEPGISEGSYINTGDPHLSENWITLPQDGLDYSWLMEAKLEEDVEVDFEVEITDYTENVDEGEEAVVEYEVTNIGDEEKTEQIDFNINGEKNQTTNVTLEEGEVFEDYFTWQTEEGDLGEYELEVSGHLDRDRVEIMVWGEWRWLYQDEWRAEADDGIGLTDPGTWYGAARFDLSFDIGDALTDVAYYDHEGEGGPVKGHIAQDDGGAPGNWISSTEEYDPEGEGWVELSLERPVMIHDPGIYWIVMEIDDAGDGNFPFGVNTPHVQDAGWINTEDPQDPGQWFDLPTAGLEASFALEARVLELDVQFDVEILDYDETVDDGEEVEVDYQVTNVGDTEETQDIELVVNGETKDSEEVTLDPMGIHVGSLTWQTEEGDAGRHNLEIISWLDREGVTVTVGDVVEWRWLYEGDWRVEGENAMGLVEPGTWYGGIRLDLPADLGNEITDIAYYDYEEDGEFVQGHLAKEDDGAPTEWIASTEEYEPEGKGWTELELNESVAIEESEEYWIVLELDDQGDGHFPFGVRGPYVDNGGFINTVDPEDPDQWGDMSGFDISWLLEARVEGEPGSHFEIEILEYDDEVKVGQDVKVQYRVNNLGAETTTQEISFKLNGDVKLTEEISVPGLGSVEEEFIWETEGYEEDVYYIGVSSEDASKTMVTLLGEPVRVEYYHVYRAEDEHGPWDETNHVGTVEADGSDEYNFVDEGRGRIDGTRWWYVVRAVDVEGPEDQNDEAIPEPVYEQPESPAEPWPEDGAERRNVDTELSVKMGIEENNVGMNESDIFSERKIEDRENILENSVLDNEDDWRRLYQDEWRAEPESSIGTDRDDWHAGIRLDLSEDAGEHISNIAYHDSQPANSVRGYIAEESGGAPGEWITSTKEYDANGGGWTELVLQEPVEIEEPGEYWIVLEIDDPGDGIFPFGAIGPAVENGHFTNYGDPHDSADWELLRDDYSLDYTWALEAYVPEELGEHFSVDITDYDEEALEGDNIQVEYEITNQGDMEGTQEIEISLNSEVIDTEEMTLEPGETKEREFIWEPGDGDAGDHKLEVSSEQWSEEIIVTIHDPMNFEVDILEVDERIIEGEELSIFFEITNTGKDIGTQEVEFDAFFEDTVKFYQDAKNVTLESGESYQSYFVWQTGNTDRGSHTIRLSSYDDFEEVEVTIDVSMDVSFYDAADDSLIETVEMVEVDDRAEIVWENLEYDSTYEWYAIADDGLTTSVSDTWSFITREEEDPYFDTTITDIDEEIVEGDEVLTEYQVENLGSEAMTQDIEFSVYNEQNELIADEVEGDLTINGGETVQGEFTWKTYEGEAGEYTIIVSSQQDGRDQAEIRVLEKAHFSLEIIDFESPIGEGETLTVGYRTENTGEAEDTQDIELKIDGDLKDTYELTLGGGEEHYGELNWNTEKGDVGEYDISVGSEDILKTEELLVVEQPFFEVEIAEYYEKAEGDQEGLTVEYEITNTGGLSEKQNIEFYVDGELIDDEEMYITGEDSSGDQFDWTPEEDGEYKLEVVSQNDKDEVMVTVRDGKIHYDFEVGVVGEGSVIIEFEDENVSVKDNLTRLTEKGTEITITAEPEENWRFDKWEGTDESEKEIKITTDSDIEITAVFEEAPLFEIKDVGVSEERLEVGEELKIDVTVYNPGEEEYTQEVRLEINPELEEKITLGEGEETTETFIWEAEEEGDYTIDIFIRDEQITEVDGDPVEDVVPEITVEEEDDTRLDMLWIVAVIIIIVILIAVFSVVSMRKGKEEHGAGEFDEEEAIEEEFEVEEEISDEESEGEL